MYGVNMYVIPAWAGGDVTVTVNPVAGSSESVTFGAGRISHPAVCLM